MVNKNLYLFSIDLEDVRLSMKDGHRFQERVLENTDVYLTWLRTHRFRCTFFVVGNVAKAYPSLIKKIYQEGHEIACHTYQHTPLDKLTPDEFSKDIELCLQVLKNTGIDSVVGFRAPIFSITQKISWAYPILQKFGFKYSSSVLPAKNSLYGWKDFGTNPRWMEKDLLEIPMTLGRFLNFKIPFAGGIYFRVLPEILIKRYFHRHCSCSRVPILGYFHPYDIDVNQESFMHPGIENSRLYNQLMYLNRSKVLPRLERIILDQFNICTYREYFDQRSSNDL